MSPAPTLPTPICDRNRFTIRWDGETSTYRVNVSCYQGGSVVPIEVAESIEQQAGRLAGALKLWADWQESRDLYISTDNQEMGRISERRRGEFEEAARKELAAWKEGKQ